MVVPQNIVAPNLPVFGVNYEQIQQQQFLNILRLFFNKVAIAINGLYFIPVIKEVQLTGFSKVIPDRYNIYIVNPVGVLATGTITMPATPYDSQIVEITSKFAITALTINANAGQSIWGWTGGSTLTAGVGTRYVFTVADATWNRIS